MWNTESNSSGFFQFLLVVNPSHNSTLHLVLIHTFYHIKNMAGREFLHEALAPVVAVAASDSVNAMLLNDGFVSLTDFFAPFVRPLPATVLTHDSNGQARQIPEFHVRLKMIDTLSKSMSSSISLRLNDNLQSMSDPARPVVDLESFIPPPLTEEHFLSEEAQQRSQRIADRQLEMTPEVTRVYDQLRDLICFNTELAEHDTFQHPVACEFLL